MITAVHHELLAGVVSILVLPSGMRQNFGPASLARMLHGRYPVPNNQDFLSVVSAPDITGLETPSVAVDFVDRGIPLMRTYISAIYTDPTGLLWPIIIQPGFMMGSLDLASDIIKYQTTLGGRVTIRMNSREGRYVLVTSVASTHWVDNAASAFLRDGVIPSGPFEQEALVIPIMPQRNHSWRRTQLKSQDVLVDFIERR